MTRSSSINMLMRLGLRIMVIRGGMVVVLVLAELVGCWWGWGAEMRVIEGVEGRDDDDDEKKEGRMVKQGRDFLLHLYHIISISLNRIKSFLRIFFLFNAVSISV